MRPRVIISLTILALIGVFLLGLWLKQQSAQEAKVSFAPAATAKSAAASTPPSSGRVAAPAAPQVTASTAASAATAKVEAKDPQADLSTAIPDIVRLVRAGDSASYMESYFAPNYLDQEELTRLRQTLADNRRNPLYRQNPFETQLEEMLAQAYADLENQKPELNSTGDEATYQWRRPTMMEIAPGEESVWVRETTPTPLTFIKINGKWYFKVRPMLF